MWDFEVACEDLYRRAYRVAFRLLGARVDAEDVASEAVARAFARWPRIEDHAEPWVCRVAANLALDVHRRRRTQLPLEVKRSSTDPEDQAALRLDLVRALGELPRRQRETVVLRYLADLPEASVTALLGCSAGTVKQHASRGLAALRAALTVEMELEDV